MSHMRSITLTEIGESVLSPLMAFSCEKNLVNHPDQYSSSLNLLTISYLHKQLLNPI